MLCCWSWRRTIAFRWRPLLPSSAGKLMTAGRLGQKRNVSRPPEERQADRSDRNGSYLSQRERIRPSGSSKTPLSRGQNMAETTDTPPGRKWLGEATVWADRYTPIQSDTPMKERPMAQALIEIRKPIHPDTPSLSVELLTTTVGLYRIGPFPRGDTPDTPIHSRCCCEECAGFFGCA